MLIFSILACNVCVFFGRAKVACLCFAPCNGFQNPVACMQIPPPPPPLRFFLKWWGVWLESRKFWLVESESWALESGIQLKASGTLLKTGWNLVPGVRNPRRGIQNPGLPWSPLHGVICSWRCGRHHLFYLTLRKIGEPWNSNPRAKRSQKFSLPLLFGTP